uniref:Uncharacterized protein n=1 Tax=Ditylenchus dipsaci TaxID=166011 RepID=A0A915E678_9BILA
MLTSELRMKVFVVVVVEWINRRLVSGGAPRPCYCRRHQCSSLHCLSTHHFHCSHHHQRLKQNQTNGHARHTKSYEQIDVDETQELIVLTNSSSSSNSSSTPNIATTSVIVSTRSHVKQVADQEIVPSTSTAKSSPATPMG